MTRISRSPRLYCDARLTSDYRVDLGRDQAHYLTRVLRLGAGAAIRLFNGTDGEWLGRIDEAGRRSVTASLEERLRAPTALPDIDYLFAPLKAARLDYLVQKATEMGVARLRPVITAHTAMPRFNPERAMANVIEAAEQCNLVALPELLGVEKLTTVLDNWSPERRLILCDEPAPVGDPVKTLKDVPPGPLAVLVGPEGGFSPDERQQLIALPFVTAISLGPRIMRADTAAVAILALVQAVLGDWVSDQQN